MVGCLPAVRVKGFGGKWPVLQVEGMYALVGIPHLLQGWLRPESVASICSIPNNYFDPLKFEQGVGPKPHLIGIGQWHWL